MGGRGRNIKAVRREKLLLKKKKDRKREKKKKKKKLKEGGRVGVDVPGLKRASQTNISGRQKLVKD